MHFARPHRLIPALAAAGAFVVATMASAQGTAQHRYDRQIAQCNSGSLPAPQRDACVRDAGRLLDNANGGAPPDPVPQPSADGRAIVMTPPGAPPPPSSSDYVTSPDGRSVTAVPPPGDRLQRP